MKAYVRWQFRAVNFVFPFPQSPPSHPIGSKRRLLRIVSINFQSFSYKIWARSKDNYDTYWATELLLILPVRCKCSEEKTAFNLRAFEIGNIYHQRPFAGSFAVFAILLIVLLWNFFKSDCGSGFTVSIYSLKDFCIGNLGTSLKYPITVL